MPFEQLTYKADSNLVGLAGTALVYYTGVGTARLPETVYCIKDNNRQFRLALSESDARAGFAVTFVPDSGAGNQHRISMRKRDSKSMLSLSGLVQKPISYTSISYELDVPVAGFVTAFVLSGISSIKSGDLIKIEDIAELLRNYPTNDITHIFHQGACSDTMEKDINYMIKNNYLFSIKKKLFNFRG